MLIYHVNPKVGYPTRCSAEDANNCPFGGPGGHNPDFRQCLKNYELANSGRLFTVVKREGPVSAASKARFRQWVNPAARQVHDLAGNLASLGGVR